MKPPLKVRVLPVAVFLSLVAFEGMCPAAAFGNTVFVKSDASGTDDGTSWMDAYTSLRSALTGAAGGDEIWVAAGTYTPTTGSDRTATLQLPDSVAVYGGFAGTETMRGQRDWMANVTVLSGDVGGPGLDDNSYHVVTVTGTSAAAVLDGFTITGGRANDPTLPGSTPNREGAGMRIIGASPTLTNLIITDNVALMRGGGVFLDGGDPSFTNVTISNNTCGLLFMGIFFEGIGGGMLSTTSNPTLINVTFTGNQSRSKGDGLLCTSATLTDCVFDGNDGEAVKMESSGTATVTGCTFVNNAGTGLISSSGINLTVTDCSFVGNSGNGMNIINGTLTNVFIADNAAITGGGAKLSGTVTVTNAVFLNNSASHGGAIYYSSNQTLTLVNVSFFGNTANGTGDAIRVVGGFALAFNIVAWGNGSSPVNVDVGASLAFNNSLVEGSGGSGAWNPGFGTDGGGNIDADPLYADTSADNLRLRAGSPAIDAGNNGAPLAATDLDGKPRTVGAAVDMGAYEFACPAGSRIYVDAGASGAADGSSWSDAFPTLQEALVVACSTVTEIWVASGTYVSTTSTDRSRTFRPRNGLTIYGGFDGTESLLGQRDLGANATVLSGDIGLPGGSDNSYHVVTGSGVDSTAVLDGFVVSGGLADGLFPDNAGAGMLNVTGSPSIVNVLFTNNSALGEGGGMYNFLGSHPSVANVVFHDNLAVASGGGMHNVLSDPILTNCTFNGNTAGSSGGLSNVSSNPAIVNTILWGDSAGEVSNVSSSPAFSYSLVQGSGGSAAWNPVTGTDGGNNLDADPLFAGAAGGDLSLDVASPAIDAGDNAAPNLPPTDIAGNPRVVFTVDMGALEHHVVTGFDDPPVPGLARQPALRAPYPNPFNPRVTISFELDRAREVTVSIYNVRGALVRQIVGGTRSAGPHRAVWDGTDTAGASVASGVYFVRLRSRGSTDQRKITLIK